MSAYRESMETLWCTLVVAWPFGTEADEQMVETRGWFLVTSTAKDTNTVVEHTGQTKQRAECFGVDWIP